MALQSQAPRVGNWRSSASTAPASGGSRRDLLGSRWMLLALALVAVALLTVLVRRMGSGTTEGPVAGDLASRAALTDPLSTPAPPTTPAATTTHAAPTTPASPPAPMAANASPAASTEGVGRAAVAGGQQAVVPAGPDPIAPAGPIAPAAPSAPAASPAPASPATGGTLPESVRQAVESAQRSVAQGRLVEARAALNALLYDRSLSAPERAGLRAQIAAINETLFFGPVVYEGDPLMTTLTVKDGDRLSRMVQSQSVPTDWRFVQRVNRLANAGAIRAGQRLKSVKVPLHAVVHKKDFRLDLYAGAPLAPGATGFSAYGPDGQAEGWTFIRSFRVGLGAGNGTPTGMFVVRAASKELNPRWVNPRTREVFERDDPKNPIGEHWLGLDGVDDQSRPFAGYGLHGTIDPESIGLERSMGCVRMLPDDIALVWELLMPRVSSVRIID